MYCVIQEIILKKPNAYGLSKELKTSSFSFDNKVKYCHSYSKERFERPIDKAYKISIHESKRVNGVVTKKQKVVTTINYYVLLELSIYDCVSDEKLEDISAYFNVTCEYLLDLIHQKLEPLENRIRREFEQTEEYKTKKRHDEIIDLYNKAKSEFASKYNVDSDEYDYCYNVFGELMNKSYLDKIIANHKNCSYQKENYSNYNSYKDYYNYNRSSYPETSSSNYTEEEKNYLKKIYRTLSKEYHPDNAKDSNDIMAFVNKLKVQWGI